MTESFETPFATIPDTALHAARGGFGAQLTRAMHLARSMGLHITSTTGGRHARHSYHYQGRAFDAAGSRHAMSAFFNRLAPTHPTELFYANRGIKHGRPSHGIPGHGNHVHVAY